MCNTRTCIMKLIYITFLFQDNFYASSANKNPKCVKYNHIQQLQLLFMKLPDGFGLV